MSTKVMHSIYGMTHAVVHEEKWICKYLQRLFKESGQLRTIRRPFRPRDASTGSSRRACAAHVTMLKMSAFTSCEQVEHTLPKWGEYLRVRPLLDCQNRTQKLYGVSTVSRSNSCWKPVKFPSYPFTSFFTSALVKVAFANVFSSQGLGASGKICGKPTHGCNVYSRRIVWWTG